MLPMLDKRFLEETADFAVLASRYAAGLVPPAELAVYQSYEIGQTLTYVRECSPFYSRRLVNIAGTENPSVAIENLPFTTKADLRTHLDEVPALPLSECWIYYETTGTTGLSTPCPRSPRDSMRTGLALMEGYAPILRNYADHCVVAVMGPTELHSTGDSFGDILRALGHTTVKMWPHSPLVGFSRALELIDRLGVNVLVCTPGMSISLARRLLQEGKNPAETSVRAILSLGELSTPGLLRGIGAIWGADVYNCMYASQEASVLAVCFPDKQLHSTPINVFYEIVDPATGRRVEAGREGERQGELVITHLYRGAKPLVRYRTGDMVKSRGSDQQFTMVPLGRVDDQIHLGDRLITAFDFEDGLLAQAPTILDYQATLSETADGRDHLSVLFEPVRPLGNADMRIHESAIIRHTGEAFGTAAEVTWGVTDSRTSTGAMVSWKAARIRDRRAAATSCGEAEKAREIAAVRERVR